MKKMCESVLLIVPCFNEAQRLCLNDFVQIREKYENIYILFVNDGSQDETEKIVVNGIKDYDFFFYHSLEKNQGKAEAVRQGMLKAISLDLFSKMDWIGFWDADLSTPIQEIPYYLEYSHLFYSDVKSIWGSRVYRLGSKIERSLLRHIMGRLFATFAHFYLNIKSYDSQCGAKLFRREIVPLLFDRPFISKWIFDIEILIRMKGMSIIEYPLRRWYDKKGSKLNVFKELWRILYDLYKIKKTYFIIEKT